MMGKYVSSDFSMGVVVDAVVMAAAVLAAAPAVGNACNTHTHTHTHTQRLSSDMFGKCLAALKTTLHLKPTMDHL